MTSRQAPVDLSDTELRVERLGPLPLVNAFLERLDLESRLERFVPSAGRRVRLPFARRGGPRFLDWLSIPEAYPLPT